MLLKTAKLLMKKRQRNWHRSSIYSTQMIIAKASAALSLATKYNALESAK